MMFLPLLQKVTDLSGTKYGVNAITDNAMRSSRNAAQLPLWLTA